MPTHDWFRNFTTTSCSVPTPSSRHRLSGHLSINPKLEVTRIPLTNGKASLFSDTEPRPSKAEIMVVLNPSGDLEWDDTKNKILIGNVRARAIVGADCTAKYMAYLSQ